jgi:hypothetical protein
MEQKLVDTGTTLDENRNFLGGEKDTATVGYPLLTTKCLVIILKLTRLVSIPWIWSEMLHCEIMVKRRKAHLRILLTLK